MYLWEPSIKQTEITPKECEKLEVTNHWWGGPTREIKINQSREEVEKAMEELMEKTTLETLVEQNSKREEDDNVRRLYLYEVTIVDMEAECLITTDKIVAGSRDEAIVKANVSERTKGLSFDDIKLVVNEVEDLGPKPQKSKE